jgi:hypothetical protein
LSELSVALALAAAPLWSGPADSILGAHLGNHRLSAKAVLYDTGLLRQCPVEINLRSGKPISFFELAIPKAFGTPKFYAPGAWLEKPTRSVNRPENCPSGLNHWKTSIQSDTFAWP